MSRSAFTRLRSRRDLVVGLLLAVFALRAFVPAGYMPSAGPSLIEMCRAGFPATMLRPGDAIADPAAPQAPAHDGAASEHCLFAALAAAPTPQPVQFAAPPPPALAGFVATDFSSADQTLRRAHQARGPPALS